MTGIDLTAVTERYHRALDAKPSKGEITPGGIAAITDSVADVPEMLAEIRRLREDIGYIHQTQREAVETMCGWQDRALAAEAAIEQVRDLARLSQRRGTHAGLLSAHSVLEALDGAE